MKLVHVLFILFPLLFCHNYSYAQKNKKKKKNASLELAISGAALIYNDHYYAAIPMLEEALTLDPTLSFAHYGLAIARLELEDLDGALININKALILDSSQSDYYSLKGHIYAEMSEHKAAYLNFKYAHTLAPTDKRFLMQLMYNQYFIDELKTADFYASKLLEIDTLNALAIGMKGAYAFQENDYEKAYSLLKKSNELDPKLKFTHITLLEFCSVNCELEAYYELIVSFENQFPNTSYTSYLKGDYYLRNENFYDAIDYLLKYNKKDPRELVTYLKLGYCYRRIDLLDKSLEILLAAKHLRPDYEPVSQELILTYIEMDENEKAIEIATTLLANDSLSVKNLKLMYLAHDNEKEGILYLKKILTIEPNNLFALFYVGLYESYQDNFEDAFYHLSKYHALDPSNSYVAFKLGTCSIKLGNREQGCMYYTKALELGYQRAKAFVDNYCDN